MADRSELAVSSIEADQYRAIASRYFVLGRINQAAEVCERGLSEHPNDGRLWELLGCVRRSAGDPAGARHALETASALVPLGVPAQLALANAYLQTGPATLANTILRHLARRGHCPAVFLPRTANLLFQAGNYRRAANMWHRIRRANPWWAEAHYRYALCLWALDVPSEDLFSPLNDAVLLAPGEHRFALTLANVWMAAGSARDAADILDTIDRETIQCPHCLERMAAIYNLADRLDEANACLVRSMITTGIIMTNRESIPL